MAGPTTEVLSEDLKGYRAEVQAIAVSLAELHAEVGIAKWLFGLVVGTMLVSFTSGIWWAATLLAETRALDARVGKLEDRFEKFEARLNKVESYFEKLQSSIDQLGALIRDQPPKTK